MELTPADALRVAINVLKDAAESRKMPSGIAIDAATSDIHADAAQVLQSLLEDLRAAPYGDDHDGSS